MQDINKQVLTSSGISPPQEKAASSCSAELGPAVSQDRPKPLPSDAEDVVQIQLVPDDDDDNDNEGSSWRFTCY